MSMWSTDFTKGTKSTRWERIHSSANNSVTSEYLHTKEQSWIPILLYIPKLTQNRSMTYIQDLKPQISKTLRRDI